MSQYKVGTPEYQAEQDELNKEFGTQSRDDQSGENGAGTTGAEDLQYQKEHEGFNPQGYSNEDKARYDRYAEYAASHGMEHANHDDRKYSTDWGGPGGVDYYRQRAAEGGALNDAEQTANTEAMRQSAANMQADRGVMAPENAVLAGRTQATRRDQLNALGLSREAALGLAPSESAFQTSLGLNNVMAGRAGQAGQARGLAGLTGVQGGADTAAAAGDVAGQGGMGRSKEIADAIGMYGTQAGGLRGQDLSTLDTGNRNARFNANLNDDWKLGNAKLLAGQGALGVQQGQSDLNWFGAQMEPADKQFQYDQEAAAAQAGHDSDQVGAQIARNRESRDAARNATNGAVTAGFTAFGSVYGGPVGGAAGGTAGAGFGEATKDWWK